MKRIIALLLVITLITPTLAEAVEASNAITYTRDFMLTPESEEEMETAFREWAALLVEAYRNQYVYVKNDQSTGTYESDFQTEMVNTYRFNKDSKKWEIGDQSEFHKELYYPYYLLGNRKWDFNISKDANAATTKHNGETIKSTDYTLLSKEERENLYLWILRETVKEKNHMDAKANLQLILANSNENQSAGRLYVFSVSDGTFKKDLLSEAEANRATKNATKDVIDGITDTAAAVIKGVIASKTISKEAAEKAVKKAAGSQANFEEDPIKKFTEGLKESAKEEAVDFGKEAIKTINHEINENMIKEINKQLLDMMMLDFVNSALTQDTRTIEYLRNTYLIDTTYLIDEEFQKAVEKVINIADSPEFAEKMFTQSQFEEDEIEGVLKDNDFDLPKVLSGGELFWHIMSEVTRNLFKSLMRIANKALDSGVDALFDKYVKLYQDENGAYQKNKPSFLTSSLEKLKNLIKNIVKEFFSRLSSTIDKAWEKTNKNQKGKQEDDEEGKEAIEVFFEEFDKAWEAEFKGIGGKKKSFSDWIIDELVLTVISLVDLINVKGEQAEYEDEHSLNPFSLEKPIPGTEKKNKTLELVLKIVAFAMKELATVTADVLKSAVSSTEYETVETGNSADGKDNTSNRQIEIYGISPAEKKEIEDLIDESKKAIESAAKMIENMNKDLKASEITEVISTVGSFIYRFATLPDSLENPQARRTLHKAIESIDMSDVAESVVKEALSGDFITDLLQSILGNDYSSEVEKAHQTEIVEIEVDSNGNKVEKVVGTIDTSGSSMDELMMEKVAEQVTKVKGSLLLAVETITKTLDKVWDSMLSAAASVATAANSVAANVTGAHLQSLDAERAFQIYVQSLKLRDVNLLYTAGNSRSQSFNNAGIRTGNEPEYREFLSIWTNGTNALTMNPDEIRNPLMTPDIHQIRALTQSILMQMHLDSVGMGAYITVLEKRDLFPDTAFTQSYINQGILMDQAEDRYNAIVTLISEYDINGDNGQNSDRKYREEWDRLFR